MNTVYQTVKQTNIQSVNIIIFSWFNLVERSEILELFRVVFYVLTSAMQDEPANKTFFMDEVR